MSGGVFDLDSVIKAFSFTPGLSLGLAPSLVGREPCSNGLRIRRLEETLETGFRLEIPLRSSRVTPRVTEKLDHDKNQDQHEQLEQRVPKT